MPKPSSTAASTWTNPFEELQRGRHPDFDLAHSRTREWAYATSRLEQRALVLWSSPGQVSDTVTGYGCGKTALAKAAWRFLRGVLNSRGEAQPALLLNAVSMFNDIKDCYAKSSPTTPLFDDWTRGNLILDDLGKEAVNNRAWAQETMYAILNRMVERKWSLLITTNLDPVALEALLGGASWSRLLGMAGGQGGSVFVDMSAVPDYRLVQGGFSQ